MIFLFPIRFGIQIYKIFLVFTNISVINPIYFYFILWYICKTMIYREDR